MVEIGGLGSKYAKPWVQKTMIIKDFDGPNLDLF
jgi:hypothetical protein